MKFDVSRVYTAVNAEELKVGSKVFVADSLKALKDNVEAYSRLSMLQTIEPENSVYRFAIGAGWNYALAYLVEEPAPLIWTDLEIGDILTKGERTAMVTQIDTNEGTTLHICAGEWIEDDEISEWRRLKKRI